MGRRDTGCHGASAEMPTPSSLGGRLLENKHRIRHFLIKLHGARAAWRKLKHTLLTGRSQSKGYAVCNSHQMTWTRQTVKTAEGRGLPGAGGGVTRGAQRKFVPDATMVDT